MRADGLLLALAGLTEAVVVGALRSVDAHLLAVLQRLDTSTAGRLLARGVLLGCQFWLVGPLLAGAAGLAACAAGAWRPALVPLAAVVIASAATLALKEVTGRTAPASGLDLLFAGGASYPSGRAANATICLPLLAALARSRPGRAPGSGSSSLGPLTCLLMLAAVAVGSATVVLGYHWPSDVAAGWLLRHWPTTPADQAATPSKLHHEHRVDPDPDPDPDPVAAARERLIDAEEAGRIAGLLGLLAAPVRARILYALDLVQELLRRVTVRPWTVGASRDLRRAS